LIPKNVSMGDHSQEQVGLIYRAFTRVTVSLADCEAAKKTSGPNEYLPLANPQLTSTVESYQKSYDAPEPEEKMPLSSKQLATGIPDPAHFFITRQQVALGQQNMILSEKSPSSEEDIKKAKERISDFERAHPDIGKSTQAFSTSRPNWINHQASEVRETIGDRAALKNEYNYTPSPMGGTGQKNQNRGKGSRRRLPPAQQSSPDSTPSPIPTL
jgi:hypothetical protein